MNSNFLILNFCYNFYYVEINGGAHDYYNVLPNKSLWKTYVENGKKLGIDFISEDAMFSGPSGN